MRANYCKIFQELAKNTKVCRILKILETNSSVTPCMYVLKTKLFCMCVLRKKSLDQNIDCQWPMTRMQRVISILRLHCAFVNSTCRHPL